MEKSTKKTGHKHKKHRHRSSSTSSTNSNKEEEQWQEAVRSDSGSDAPGGAIVKGPTMPSQADLEEIVTMINSRIYLH
jgi:hypothetical protein